MHGMLAYGVHSQIRQGGPQGKPITLVGWLCYNRPCKGFTLLYVTPENELRAKQGVGLQGHMGQFLAMLAQCQVSPDYPIRVRDQEFTINDLIEAEKKTCYPKTELTFKLIALMHYLDSDETWVNDQGQSWDIPRLIREELAQPIRGAACGGTHRLSGPEPGRPHPRPPRRTARRRIPPRRPVRREVSAVRLPAAEPRRQPEHRVVPRPRRRGRHRPPRQNHRPHSRVALLLAQRQGRRRAPARSGP